ncbi:NAD(P)-binding protein [Lentithecium fluviatile CBS 122367]|uniref:NAD(P)-binding protein n=1 Tax=Lentithecium fluviatile CBS 122367 TaxID=1168545 RepID=A0A6G1JIV5_9PLEO|nr:NAD(P)-binding protein [Lentithecium fluviatile CBS 122367]
MSQQETTFASDERARQEVFDRKIKQTGRFTAQATAEEVAAALATDIAGKTVIITGASPAGIGAEAARVVFKHRPSLLILASRSKKANEETIAAIGGGSSKASVKGVEIDLSDLDSVRKAVVEILELTPVLDVLINNAGIMMLQSFQTTKHGVEMQFGTNHLGHFLLTNLLMPAMLVSPSGARVVNVSSAGHHAGGVNFKDINYDNGTQYDPFVAYGQSKTANILFSLCLASKLKNKGLQSFSVDPGAIKGTSLSRNIPLEKKVAMGWWRPDGSPVETIPWQTVEHGASTYIVTGFDHTIDEHNGKYFARNSVDSTVAAHAQSPESAEKLWLLSEELVGQQFRYD